MKITNIEKGEDYNLKPDTQIQVERTNPFFNDYGEQTTPLELPSSERNRRILGFPDSFGRRVKMTATDVAIQDGEYSLNVGRWCCLLNTKVEYLPPSTLTMALFIQEFRR